MQLDLLTRARFSVVTLIHFLMASLETEDRQDEVAPLLPEHLGDLPEKQGKRMTADEIRNKHRLTERNDRFSKKKAANKGAHGSSPPPPDVSSHSHGSGGLQVSVRVHVRVSTLQKNSSYLCCTHSLLMVDSFAN